MEHPSGGSALSYISTASLLLQQFCRVLLFPLPDEETEAEKGLYGICYILSFQKFEINKVSVTSYPLEIMH